MISDFEAQSWVANALQLQSEREAEVIIKAYNDFLEWMNHGEEENQGKREEEERVLQCSIRKLGSKSTDSANSSCCRRMMRRKLQTKLASG